MHGKTASVIMPMFDDTVADLHHKISCADCLDLIYKVLAVVYSDAEMQEAEGDGLQEPEVMLNYDQYYPTLLPVRQPGMEETDTEAHARDDRPPDLSLHKVRNAVQQCSSPFLLSSARPASHKFC